MRIKYTSMEKYDEILEILFDTMPYVFWKDKTGKYLGGNLNQALNLGFKTPEEFVGKTIFEILGDKTSAQLIDEIDNKVMNENITLVKEEKIITPLGQKTYSSQKSPIHNKKGEVVGMIGFAMDITEIKKQEELARKERDILVVLAAKKEAERLKLENQARTEQLETLEKFTKMANQVAHDIRSPLASLLMIVKSCKEIPERERIALRAASMRISDIANHLLNQYKLEKTEDVTETKGKTPILISATLLQLLTEKKFQYQDHSVTFDYQCDTSAQFAFIYIVPTAFKRMISNLINNGVDSFENKPGTITIKLIATNDWVNIVVEDNGKGMQSVLIKKIMNNMSITKGKVDGHGIGLTQVRETLSGNDGTLAIQSQIGEGTEVKIQFQRVRLPAWITEEIQLNFDDIVVILDDDHSIHGAWDSRFEPILEQSGIKLHHFEQANETLQFFSKLNVEEKKRVLLLTDFELLNQELNGLDVIEKSNVPRSLLVTSHYDDPSIQERSILLGTHIVPKQLASEIPIFIDKEGSILDVQTNPQIKFVHAIIVDDDEQYVQNLRNYIFDEEDIVDYFKTVQQFKEHLANYSKDTLIYLDNNLGPPDFIKGVVLAEELHKLGYTKLYLLTGDKFRTGELPNYLTVIRKSDLDKIKIW